MTSKLPFIGISGKEYEFKTPTGSHVELVERLGTGLAGEVWLVNSGKDKSGVDDMQYALKVYTDPLTDERKKFMFDTESEMKIHDRRTVGPISSGAISDSSVGVQHAILFPYVESTRLDKWVSESPDMKVKLSLCQSIAGMMSQLRKPLGWLHNDMKPENILVVLYGEEDDRFDGEREEIRIIDFQLSCKVSEVDKIYGRRRMPGGTLPYMAPEVSVEGGGARYFSTASDVWALSATLLYTITGKTLWDHLDIEDAEDFIQRASDDRDNPIVGHEVFDLCAEDVPMGIQRAILEGLIPNPLQRIDVTALNHVLKSKGIASDIAIGNLTIEATEASIRKEIESALGCKIQKEYDHHLVKPISGLKEEKARVLVDIPLSDVSKHYDTKLPSGIEISRYLRPPEGSQFVAGKKKGIFQKVKEILTPKGKEKPKPKPAVKPKPKPAVKPKPKPVLVPAVEVAVLPFSEEGYLVRLIFNTDRPDQPIFVPPDEEIPIGRKNISPGNDEIRSRHMTLMATESGLKIKARAPIRLNGVDLSKGDEAPLSPASIIEVGGIVIRIGVRRPRRLE